MKGCLIRRCRTTSSINWKNAWRNIFVNRLNKGPETLYGSPLKEPEHFYKFADTTRYNYPEDLPDTYSRPAQPEWPNY